MLFIILFDLRRKITKTKLWKEPKNVLKHTRVQLNPYTHPTPTPFVAATIFCMWVRRWTCQISNESVRGFWSPRGLKMILVHRLGTSPLQQCTY